MRLNAWKTIPILALRTVARRLSGKSVISMPSTSTRPELGLSSPAMTPSRVLLPLPLGPTRAANSPGSMRMSMPRRISIVSPPSGRLRHTSTASSAAGRPLARDPVGPASVKPDVERRAYFVAAEGPHCQMRIGAADPRLYGDVLGHQAGQGVEIGHADDGDE